jgi:hypothetical protein
MTNSNQLRQLLQKMHSSRLDLARGLTRKIRVGVDQRLQSMTLLQRFGMSIAVALGVAALLRKRR